MLGWTLLTDVSDDDLTSRVPDLLSGYGLDGDAVRHLVGGARAGVRRPSLRTRGSTTALSVRLLDYDDVSDAVESGEEWLLVHDGRAISIIRPPLAGAAPVAPSPVPAHFLASDHPLSDLAHGVLEAAVEGYEAVVAALEEDVDEVETSVFSPRRTADAARIYTLKREVAETRRAVLPLIDLLQRHARPEAALAFLEHHRGSVDLHERLHRLAEQVETLDELLSSILDAYVARVSVQQNEDMRRISAGAALVVVPTFLAGVWGMNFDAMPELHWAWGYPMALLSMGVSVALLWWSFRRTGWF